MLGIGMGASAYSTSAVFLQHKGNITTYEPEAIQEALDAAEDGDIVLLNEGTFPGFEIKKRISVRGAGESSIIEGSIVIAISDTTRLTSTLLESISMPGYYDALIIDKSPKGIIIKKCVFTKLSFGNGASKVDDILIDRCFCTSSEPQYNGGLSVSKWNCHMTVVNSKINALGIYSDYSENTYKKGANTTFIHCNIGRIYADHSFLGTIKNSIVNNFGTYEGGDLYTGAYYNNLMIKHPNADVISIKAPCVFVDNYIDNYDTSMFMTNGECAYDTETLINKGYLGNDGTVVGIYGGATPYTLEPTVPKVLSSQMQLDKENKKLNVTLTVSPK